MMRNIRNAGILVLLAGMAGLAYAGHGKGSHQGECPMMVPGTKITTGNVDGGIAVIFTTTRNDQVDELRQNVRAMAARQQQMMQMHGGPGQMRMQGGAGQCPCPGMRPPGS